MPYRRKTWGEKLADKPGLPKILELRENYPCYPALARMGVKPGEKVVLVNPSEVVAEMRMVPEGKLTTITEICSRLAKSHGVKGCCTLTAGIFITSAANAAEEAATEGSYMGIPYWRTLKTDGFLNDKFPGGAEAQGRLLESEGHRILRRGRRLFVAEYENKLIW